MKIFKKKFPKVLDKSIWVCYNTDRKREGHTPKRKERKAMRLVHYYVINKVTGEKENKGCYRAKAEEAIASKADKENWFIGMKWLSI